MHTLRCNGISQLVVTITCVSNEIMTFEWNVVNIEMKLFYDNATMRYILGRVFYLACNSIHHLKLHFLNCLLTWVIMWCGSEVKSNECNQSLPDFLISFFYIIGISLYCIDGRLKNQDHLCLKPISIVEPSLQCTFRITLLSKPQPYFFFQ